jgi:hypothetical protein
MSQSAPAALRILNPIPSIQGPDGLPAINTTELPDGAIVVVLQNNSIYQLRKSSVAAQVVPDIMAPATSAWPGRWFLNGKGAQDFQNVDLVVPDIHGNEGTEVDTTVNGAEDGDIIVFNLRQSGVPTGLAITSPYISAANAVKFKVLNGTGATISGGTYTLRVAVLPSS